MTVHPDFHVKAGAVDRELAAGRQSTRAERPTPESTIEAVMVAVRARGIGALKEPANLDRIRRCDAKAKAEINERIDKLFQKGILK
jgi:hypothetical protein